VNLKKGLSKPGTGPRGECRHGARGINGRTAQWPSNGSSADARKAV